jgi:hypothetical protein
MNPNIRGSPPGDIYYTNIDYNDKKYIVGTIFANGEPLQFVFDEDEKDKVIGKSWHRSSNTYIASSLVDNGKRKQLFLHNVISNRLNFPGKGSTETIDHINRNGFDNRKENLRILTQSEQNMNQIKRQRNITLPEGCEVLPEEIPRHIWYIKAHGAHGDRFAIEFKSENLCWKTTSSKKISLKQKLEEAKDKLKELYVNYPHLNPFAIEKIQKEQELTNSFNEIIRLSLEG